MIRRHVALIGLMGSGKSTVARVVASSLGLRAVDVDETILSVTGRTVRELWSEGGEHAYRGLERGVVLDTLGSNESAVLAVPAGAAIDPLVRDALADPGVFTVWLRARVDTLVTRVGRSQHRPLLDGEPADVLRGQADARSGIYEATADLAIDVDERTPDEIGEQVITALRSTAPRPPRVA
jgi:shikimate kinase